MSEDRPLLARRLRLWHLVAVDAVAAVVLTIAHVSFAESSDGTPLFTGPSWVVWLVAVAASGPVAVRRLWPLPTLAVALAGGSVATLADLQREPFVPVACTLYLIALTQPYRRSLVVLVTSFAVAAAAVVVNGVVFYPGNWRVPFEYAAFTGLVFTAVWAVAVTIRTRREYDARAAEQLANSAVTDERLRIARDLHDVVAHSMSLIAVKAGIANHVADERPEEARDALRVIEATSRGTLTEMRRILGVLRSDGGADLAPAPGLDGLAELAERARMAGVDVRLTVAGPDLPEGAAMSVYRIVQEALTNVAKHAAPATCEVSVTADGTQVRVEVADDGPGGLPGGGHGLIGMRERVMTYGGTFTAGPRPQGGFGVSAVLPYDTVLTR